MAKEIKIKIRDLHKSFGKKHVLNGVDLDLYKGESLVVIGGSGTGKSVRDCLFQTAVQLKLTT